MHIKRIEIIGFKSFPDKTVLHINQPITAVVGPNGCGKSNIIDAVRWCMGEQSAKHLRGKAMEDVIFGGSESRGAGGMAEVSLTFENVGVHGPALERDAEDGGPREASPSGGDDDEESPLKDDDGPADGEPPPIDFTQYGEVTVTRRLFRDGASEYELNKTACRLRDITDFFLGTGVGTKAYSIIEQGRVGMIVSAKPEERRLLIEEAAGITKFKKKKAAAEKKMEQTRQNLLRVSDIVSEIDKQLGSLRRQAQKAERYKKYRAEVRDLELWSASHRYLGLTVEAARARGELETILGQRDAAQAEHSLQDATVIAERAVCSLEERRLADLTQVVFDLENRLKLGESQRDFQLREAGELEARAQAAGSDIEGLNARLGDADAEAARMRVEAARLEEEHAARGRELARLEAALVAAREQLRRAQGELDAARAEIGRAQADIARHENHLRGLDRRKGDLELRRDRSAEEEAKAGARHAELAVEIAGHEDRLGGLRQLRMDLDQQRGSLESRLAELKSQLAHDEAEVETLRTELHRRRSRQKALREIMERYEGFARGTRAVMKHRPGDAGGKRILGLVADIVQAPAEYEPAVEAVLGDRLGSILVENQDVGAEAVGFLKRRSEGRSSFIPVESFSSQSAGIEVVEAEGVRGPMRGFIRCADEYAPIADHLFAGVTVVESLPRALELWQAGVRQTLVTLDGDIVDRHGVVSGGSRETAGASVLSQKREVRELEEICAALEQDLATAGARHVAGKAELSRVGAALDAVRKNSHDGDYQLLSSEKDLTRFRAEAERLAERRAQLARERAELDGALTGCAHEIDESSLALTAARASHGDAEARQLGLVEGVTSAHAETDAQAGLVTECKVRVAEVGAGKSAARAQLGRVEAQVGELRGRIERLGASIEDDTARAAGLRDEASRAGAELVLLRAERRARADELAAGRSAHEQRTGALATAEIQTRELRQRADRLAAETTRLELRLGSLDGDRRHLEESIAERHRVVLARELGDHHLRPPVGEAEEARLRELRELIERMGEINLTAIEELAELSKRHEFLTGQKQDLENALGQLDQAIAKINKTSRKRFKETYDAVNLKFQEVFPRLFRGGRAELRLVGVAGTAPDDLLDAGVEIFAQPPGKKNTTVELLSGGEKALTAVSLIFAIFLIKPSPFCILDEVDAPLDEANVSRYNDLVREMTDRSQFIVITHNKRTMEIADRLFGITMEEPGCSKLVSVNLRAFGEQRAA